MNKTGCLLTALLLLFLSCCIAQQGTFTNPLLPSGADPYSFYKDGFFYYTNTIGDRLSIWKTKNIAELATAEKKTVFHPPPGKPYSKQLWAPELLFLKGRWYIYFAADNGNNKNHQLYVLENRSPDPLKGSWKLKGKVSDPSGKWAIDADVFEYNSQLYMIWSGWEGDSNGSQEIYIAKMKNPWTISGERYRISSARYPWEKHGDLHDTSNPPHVNVNEGPQFLKHNEDLFIIYSASGCWTDFYALGMLRFKGRDNLLDSASWVKHPEPVFKASIKNEVYAPGHNSFFKSPDGKEDWLLYHANDKPGQGCGRHRSPRAQKFTWKENGDPDFGEPVRINEPLPLPSAN